MGRTILFLDGFAGVSGDMILGALSSLGVPLEVMSEAVDRVIPGEVRLEITEVTRAGFAGLHCEVIPLRSPVSRSLEDMLRLVERAGLTVPVREGSQRVLKSLGWAEGLAHGAGRAAHLHELGGQDTLADVVGSLAGLHHLDVDEVVCGPLNTGSGTVQSEHGVLPVPAPATARLLEGFSVYSDGPPMERTTPTGAALVREMTSFCGPLPAMTVDRVGVGAGSRDTPGYANLLRVFYGQAPREPSEGLSTLIECGIDDVSPEYLAPVTEALHAAGAREVHFIPVHTKKGRVGVLLRVLAPRHGAQEVIRAVLEQTGSSGLRFWQVDRVTQPREVVTVQAAGRDVRIKRWRTPGGRWQAKPEFEDVMEASRSGGKTPSEVRDLAMAAYLSEHADGQKEN